VGPRLTPLPFAKKGGVRGLFEKKREKSQRGDCLRCDRENLYPGHSEERGGTKDSVEVKKKGLETAIAITGKQRKAFREKGR